MSIMKKYAIFAFGTIFGAFIATIMAYKFAERMVATKQSIRDDNRKRGTPIFWWGRWLGRLFITPKETTLTSKNGTYYQYPSKAELAQKPGQANDDFYDKYFLKYIVFRKLTDQEAFEEVQKDYPEFLPKKLGGDYKLLFTKTKRAFIEAMRRRRIKLSKRK